MMARSQQPNKALAADEADPLTTILLLLIARMIWATIRFWFTLSKWAVLFPMISVPLLVALIALDLWRPWIALFVLAVSAAMLFSWWLVSPKSFRRLLTGRIVARWRKWRTYTTRWERVCALHGLAPLLDSAPVVPRLRKVRIGDTLDELHVDLVFGQTIADWSSRSESIAHAFNAQSSVVSMLAPGRIAITLHRLDRLGPPIALRAPAAHPDLEHLTIGVSQSGKPWEVRVLGRHMLVAGVTGAGKGSVVWSILNGCAPLISDGTVQAWVIDPKGGMEFGQGARLFRRFAYDAQEGALFLLRDAAETLTRRANQLRGSSRQHVPSPDEPLIVVVIDELASLIAYQTDRKVSNEISQLLALILSQGRAVGVVVIAAVQDPSKDTIALRQLFPTRIGLRLAESSQVDMVLGAGARSAGALCDQIPDCLPGVGYVMEDGRSTPLRARAFNVTDADILELANSFGPGVAPAIEFKNESVEMSTRIKAVEG